MPYSREGKPQVRETDIVAGLRALGIRRGDRMFVHSSLSAFGYVDGGAEAVCDALIETVGADGTVAVPTFTWGLNHRADTVVFDVRDTPCELGAIPEAFRQRPAAVRDEHVCHSIAAIGAQADEVLGDGVRPFAQGSGMHRLYEMDFWYVLLGCPFSRTTALHTAEELMQVPYRRYRDFAGSTVVRGDGTSAPSRSVEFLCVEPYHPDFTSVAPTFEAAGIQRSTTVGNARIVNAKARDLVDLAVAKLTDDIAWLLADGCRERFTNNRADLESDGGAPSA